MNNLLSLKFWFNTRPGMPGVLYQRGFFVFIGVLIVCAFVFALLRARDKKNLYNPVWQNFFSFSLTNAIIGLILLFFTYELIPVLSSRFWFLFWGIEMIIWLVFIGKTLAGIPQKRKQLEQEREYKKYIP
ncbi:hypothetical protein KJ586_03185 [Patescibacteria group bacterium]|nr:hypothetical protein [Patescibacteria group bacterium]MBU4455488.1 hypothetical protein [Patescibacteria group bacterium]MCG2690496.1 hypothetical protein [Candidatus Parcubacteria bacterium]